MMPMHNVPLMQQHQQFLPVPYVGAIPSTGSPTLRRVTVVGSVPPTAARFSINLQCGPNTSPVRDDIALHMQFRFDAQVPYVARNHLQSQVWGVEEAHGYLSFGRGQQFELRIDPEHDHFKIYLNNMHFTDFRHRLPALRVSYLAIDGDVVLSAILFDGQSMMPMSMPSGYNQPMGLVNPNPMPGIVGVSAPYPTMPTGAVGLGNPMMSSHVYPGYPSGHSGMHSSHGRPGYHATSSAIPMAAAGVGTGLVAGALMHGANKKMMKKQKKMMKKAMKPHKFSHKFKHKHFHHGMHHKGSSSSSSGSSD